jgi:hypothetical protein
MSQLENQQQAGDLCCGTLKVIVYSPKNIVNYWGGGRGRKGVARGRGKDVLTVMQIVASPEMEEIGDAKMNTCNHELLALCSAGS